MRKFKYSASVRGEGRFRKLSCDWNRLSYGLSGKVSLFVCALLTTFTIVFITVNTIAEQEVVE